MTALDGEDAIDRLREEIISEVSSEENRTLLQRFISWISDQNDQQPIPVLYAWYQMVQHIDFDLADASEDDLATLLAAAEPVDQDTWERALHTFYGVFMRQERGSSIDISSVTDQ